MNQLDKAVAATISELERQNQPQPVKMEIVDDADDADGNPPPWQSDAERKGLPLVNEHDDKGAPLLDRDKVLKRSLPNCVGLR